MPKCVSEIEEKLPILDILLYIHNSQLLSYMKNNLFILLALTILVFSCGKTVQNEKKTEKSKDESVVKEYYSNGKIKTEISAKGQLRQGPTRNYDRNGLLLSEVNYDNNIMDGMVTNYYAKSGKINSTFIYKKGIKEGDEIWYYESGKPYRVSPYIHGKIEGVQKHYFEDGKLQAEVNYKNGMPGMGLKEYKPDGTLISDYPTIIIRKENHLQNANKIILIISLSNNKTTVKFYKGALLDGKYLHQDLFSMATQQGRAEMDYNVTPGTMIKQDIIISANYKTPMGNPCVITKHYRVEAAN
jgi:antitoxin component YwqK of YwqJK toxin-antitoxin module